MPPLRYLTVMTSLVLSLGFSIAGQASNELSVHHDGVATAKEAFEEDILVLNQALQGAQVDVDALSPPNAAPGLPTRPNGCVRVMPDRPKNILYSVGSGYRDVVDYARGQCESTYTYRHYTCRSNFEWDDTGTSTEVVVTNVQCGGES